MIIYRLKFKTTRLTLTEAVPVKVLKLQLETQTQVLYQAASAPAC
jgi:hypothetical protein